jgi:hypothetical protein
MACSSEVVLADSYRPVSINDIGLFWARIFSLCVKNGAPDPAYQDAQIVYLLPSFLPSDLSQRVVIS